MKRVSRRVSRYLVLMVLTWATTGLGQKKNQDATLRFEGCTITAEPYRGPGHESIPVEVVDLSMKDAGYEIRIADLALKNRSSKPVKEIELNWVLVKGNHDRGTVVKEGLATSRRFPNDLAAGARITLRFPVIAIRKMMFGGVELSGDFRIEVAVTPNVFYKDGTGWKPRSLFDPYDSSFVERASLNSRL